MQRITRLGVYDPASIHGVAAPITWSRLHSAQPIFTAINISLHAHRPPAISRETPMLTHQRIVSIGNDSIHRRSFSLLGSVAICAAVVAVNAALAVHSSAQDTLAEMPSDYLSGAHVKVTHEGSTWTITGTKRTVTIHADDLGVSIDSAGVQWPLNASNGDDLVVQNNQERFDLAMKDAGKIEITPYDTGAMTGVKIDIAGFHHGAALDLGIQLFIGIEGADEDVVCKAVAQEGACAVKELRWPGGLQAGFADRSVVPMMQGVLIPRDWPRKVAACERLTHSRGLYMPWWGFEKNGSAMGVILETADDAGMDLTHPAGGPTAIRPVWVHSLGKLSYTRIARLCFLERGGYVELAKRYRRHVVENGRFVSLKEKIARSPLVARLIGSPVLHTQTTWHCEPESIYFDKQDASKNDTCTTFDQTAERLRQLHSMGVERIYLHLDGWGYRGYDNLHPDIVPPSPIAGEWGGMRRLGDVCEELGYVFAIHDQYRDYYTKAASYCDRHAVYDENGNVIKEATWPGGEAALLCASLAPAAVKRNYRALLEHGVKVRGAYLDVFSVVTPDECYNPEHRMTRTQCLKYQSEAFGAVRSLLGIVSSEEPTDGAVADLDIVHHGPYALDPNSGGGPAKGIPIPLFNLVYHDSIVLPWPAHPDRGGWGIPDTDIGYLHAMLNAGIPFLSLTPIDAEIQRVRKLCALHDRLGLLEMTGHEFLDTSMRKQRTTYADGTRVTVDFDGGDFTIEPALTQSELSNALSRF